MIACHPHVPRWLVVSYDKHRWDSVFSNQTKKIILGFASSWSILSPCESFSSWLSITYPGDKLRLPLPKASTPRIRVNWAKTLASVMGVLSAVTTVKFHKICFNMQPTGVMCAFRLRIFMLIITVVKHILGYLVCVSGEASASSRDCCEAVGGSCTKNKYDGLKRLRKCLQNENVISRLIKL